MRRIGFLMGTSLLSASLALAQPPTYTVLPLPEGAFAFAVNKDGSGEAAGFTLSGSQLPATFTPDSTTPLEVLPGGTFGLAADQCGDFTYGYCGAGIFSLQTHACRWHNADPPEDLGTAGGFNLFSAAAAGNCEGTLAVGRGDKRTGTDITALVFTADGVTELPTFEPAGFAAAEDLDGHLAVGNARLGDSNHCALWDLDQGTVVGCIPPNSGTSFGMAVAADHVLVQSFGIGSGQRAYLREPDGTFQELLPLPGLPDSTAFGINAAGLIGGASAAPADCGSCAFVSKATLWQDEAGDLLPVPIEFATLVTNPEGWDEFRRILGVGAGGVLAGEGVFQGERRFFLAFPATLIAEPPPPDPEEPPAQREGRRRIRAKALERWQKQQTQYQDKIARWEKQVQACKATHKK